MPELQQEGRARLTESGSRLRASSHILTATCARHGVRVPDVLRTWPVSPRRGGGWARATESDEAEDERLHTVIVAGRHVVGELTAIAPDNPTVRLSRSAFLAAADRYARDSVALHDACRNPDVAVEAAARGLGAAAEMLASVVEHANGREVAGDARLVPLALREAVGCIAGDLVLLGPPGPASEADPVYRLLARNVDGALGVVGEHVDSCPEAILLAAEQAADALETWGRASGAFRPPRATDLVRTAVLRRDGLHPYDATAPEVVRRAQAETRLTGALGELAEAARLLGDPALHAEARALERETRGLGAGVLAPIGMHANDAFLREVAQEAFPLLQGIVAGAIDSREPPRRAVGVLAEVAMRACDGYLAASEALAVHVREWSWSRPLANEDVVRVREAAARFCAALEVHVVGDADLQRRGLGDIARAELTSLEQDLVRTGVTMPGGSGVADVEADRAARRLSESVHGVLCGDAGAHIGQLAAGHALIDDLQSMVDRLDAALGIAVPGRLAREGAGQPWLATVAAAREPSGRRGPDAVPSHPVGAPHRSVDRHPVRPPHVAIP